MPVRFDWRGYQHGPVVGPVHAGVASAAVAAVGGLPTVGLPVSAVAITAAIGAGVTALRSAHNGLSRMGLAGRLAAWVLAPGWVGWVLTEGWSPQAVFALGAGTAVGGVGARMLATHEQRVLAGRKRKAVEVAQAIQDEQVQEELHGIAAAWVSRIQRVCKKQVKVAAIEHWRFPGPEGVRETGYTLELELPADGTTIDTLSPYADALASAANLPHGCGVEFGASAAGRRQVLMRVSTHDALRDVIPLPLATGPRSLNDPVDLAVYRDGSKALLPLRYESALLTGQVGSGKSNMLQTLIARLLECDDVLVCVIDYNGGGVALDWLAEWAQGNIGRPPIFWVADNPEEAALLTGWLIAVIEHRKLQYATQNRANNDDKIAISAKVPQIVLVTDEVAALSAPIVGRIVQISNRGRAAAVRAVTCSLRATSIGVDREILVQAQTRIGMRMSDVSEIAYLFGWIKGGARPTPADAPETGYAFVGVDGGFVRVAKGYRTDPKTVLAVARATDAHRPELDQITVDLPGDWKQIYMDRWIRARRILEAAGGGVPAGAGAQSGPAGGTGGSKPKRPDSPLPPPHPGGMKGALNDMEAAADRLREASGGGPARPGGSDDDAFDAIIAGLDGGVVPELLVRILGVMEGVERMHTATIAAAVGARRETLGALLSPLGIRPLPNAFRVDGQDGRGYRRVDVEAAAQRIRDGDLTVPPEVAAWKPPTP